MIRKLTTIPLQENNYNNKLIIIKLVAINHTYNSKLIEKRKNYKNALDKIYPFITDPTVEMDILTHFGSPSDKTTSIVVKSNVNITFKADNNLVNT